MNPNQYGLSSSAFGNKRTLFPCVLMPKIEISEILFKVEPIMTNIMLHEKDMPIANPKKPEEKPAQTDSGGGKKRPQ